MTWRLGDAIFTLSHWAGTLWSATGRVRGMRMAGCVFGGEVSCPCIASVLTLPSHGERRFCRRYRDMKGDGL